ncbi:MAG: DUF1016 N-terminal domain-containing protein [Nitrospira sp.]|nr:DUF1016 N-terminal domain-containing protein [Nitrospira sp.]
MTAAYWLIGRRIVESEQKGEVRAEYGEALIERLAAHLSARYGKGFSVRNVWQMRAFYLAWPNLQTPSAESDKPEILQTPSAESSLPILSAPSRETGHGALELFLKNASFHFPLPWSAYVRLLAVKNEHARRFYETEALRGGWSVRQLDRLPNKVLAAEYRTALPDEKELAAEIERTRAALERRAIAPQSHRVHGGKRK